MAATRTLKVDVTSDFLCPFCLLGVRQLELAIEKYRERDPEPLNVEICMRPFQLNGLISELPMLRSEYGEKKFGAERWKCVCDSLAAKFKSVGIDYKTDGSMSQSHLAHRLTEYAGQIKPAAQLAVAMDVFNLYHVKGVHLSDREGLAEIGVQHGLFSDKEDGLAWFFGTACDHEVKKQYQTAQRMGITGVPFFVFQDKYAASGAMGVDEFVDILCDIQKRETDFKASPTPFRSGEQCSVDDHGPQAPPSQKPAIIQAGEQCPIQAGGGHCPPAPQPAIIQTGEHCSTRPGGGQCPLAPQAGIIQAGEQCPIQTGGGHVPPAAATAAAS
ncbi:hypothetical protein CspeluHIS016_0114320 [Cutaneotrichosporon spelunceum]|uniref:DSBA-like thioredoxin domain-containing protein n=1 Tax=Cutaneotrichosporon spelunceum TaxID=1672016 RepID=A0AAD3Y9F8_9TREE|nr:hypothetical protein CspeluHIS016_0114320 [Cutaneotrichosporon spelunceum]